MDKQQTIGFLKTLIERIEAESLPLTQVTITQNEEEVKLDVSKDELEKHPYTLHELELINKLHHLARLAQVDYELSYSDGSNDWYVSITSAAPSENFIGKDRSILEHALTDAIEYLETFQTHPTEPSPNLEPHVSYRTA